MSNPSVIVVGGGLVGLSSAVFLLERGAEVTVIDHGPLGGGAARGNAGFMCTTLLAPLPAPGVMRSAIKSLPDPKGALRIRPRVLPGMAGWMLRFARASTAARHESGRTALAQLRPTHALLDRMEAMGVDVTLTPDVVVPFHDAALAEHFCAELAPMEVYGVKLPRLVDGEEMRQVVPALTAHVNAGFVVPGDRAVDPRTYVDSMIAVLRARGARIVEDAPPAGFEHDGGRVRAVVTPKGRFDADQVVLSAGSGSRLVARQLGLRIPVVPGQGYNVALPVSDGFKHPVIFEEPHVVATPFADRIRLGGTMEFAGDRPTFDARRVDAIIAKMRLFLDLDWEARTEPWAGCRPMSADGLPVLGRPAGWSNLVLATGHGMWGVTLSPATGNAVAELVLDGRSSADITALDPSRF